MIKSDWSKYAYYSFEPRRNQPERYDQQMEFFKSKHPGVTFLLGGNGSGTTTCALAKIVEFMIKTPAPRHDTPIWIIGPTYASVMGSCWDEKLDQQGHLPPQHVEWSRIHWYKPNQNWPYSVPLLPMHGDSTKNWKLVFKSFIQGRTAMQAESIGAFLFVEQFPWGLLTEVLRGTREYNFVGNKLVEFTPVDPHLSAPLQEMEEEDKLPRDWAIYRANAECALEAGHISQQSWDNFYSTLPESMRDVRTKGLWGGYEGLIYPEFNIHVHCLPDDWEVPPSLTHRRSIDWGSGQNNAQVCLFAARDGLGCWYIYDEYYSTDVTLDTIRHLKQIQDMVYWPQHNPKYGVTWADPAGLDRFRIAGRMAEYAPGYQSMNIQPAYNSQQAGIDHIKYLLTPDKALALPDVVDEYTGMPKAQPRLFILKHKCKNLVRELRSYQWMKQPDITLNPKNVKMVPQDFDNHCCDALRYLLYSESCQTNVAPTVLSTKHLAREPAKAKRPRHMRRMT